jgi:predicted transcriptional regulator
MLTKSRIKEQIDKLPEEFSLDELIERLILIEKIESGIKQSENGEVISEEEMDNEIEKWFK